MAYFVNFDSNNKIDGFFNNAINSLIPDTAIQITDEKWQELSSNPEKYRLQAGQIILVSEILQSEPIPLINWAEFNRSMQSNAAYNQFISDAVDKDAVRRLETLAITLGVTNRQDFNLDDLKLLWNFVLQSIPTESLPLSSAVSEWNEIANNCYMNFEFMPDGSMTSRVPPE
ncbi:hypothetical protein IQ244_27835 [Nostoc sp. LEGE 06077]|uniref:hypothetical protein n=1 Tax=Nostoc sp. LEGE 06077 TaxID=915325 RepID=UPI0018814DD1|nr:hypothetical protein [Nostoc sp. LEGE 06077]MBE9210241.1 hypothetical protein [Nostoc sp. LEGE 06077]